MTKPVLYLATSFVWDMQNPLLAKQIQSARPGPLLPCIELSASPNWDHVKCYSYKCGLFVDCYLKELQYDQLKSLIHGIDHENGERLMWERVLPTRLRPLDGKDQPYDLIIDHISNGTRFSGLFKRLDNDFQVKRIMFTTNPYASYHHDESKDTKAIV